VLFATVLAAAGVCVWLTQHGSARPIAAEPQIAFLRGDRVYLMNADGSAQRATRVGSFPAWSHNGRWVVFASKSYKASTGYTVRVYVANRDGSGRRVIARAVSYDPCFDADWSRDDAKIAYTVGCDVDFMDLFVVGRDGSGLRRLAQGGYGKGAFYAVGPDWSPDGRTILVAGLDAHGRGPFRLFVIDVDGQRRAIPRSSLELGPDLGRYSWSRDGRRIFFVDDRSGSPALFVINRDGMGRERISPEGLRRIISFELSPNGAMITFTGGDGQRRSVYVINVDGSGLQRLTDGEWDREPSWSPDGRRIVFNRFDTSLASSQVEVMRSDGSKQRNISRSTTDDTALAWVPLPHG
jgi:Tol biopolymer transport system component